MNWDLFAVALSTGALLAFARGRNGLTGVLLGLGAAAKFYPALLMVPLIAQRRSKREPEAAITVGWATVGTWFLVNLPFAIASPTSWSTFFRFNSSRAADFDSLWYIGCRHVDVGAICGHTSRINVASFTLFAVSFALVWLWKQRREPEFVRWNLAFPLLVLFLLFNKVYSPQYGLWAVRPGSDRSPVGVFNRMQDLDHVFAPSDHRFRPLWAERQFLQQPFRRGQLHHFGDPLIPDPISLGALLHPDAHFA
jgi:uncharacterized membrane protein